MKRTRMMIGVAVASFFLAGVSADAKFGVKIPKAPASGGGDISGLKADLESMTSSTIKDVVKARILFKESYAELAEALGLKEEAIKLKSEADALKDGNTSASDLKKQVVISEESKAKIKEKLNALKEVTPKQRKLFWNAVGTLTDGIAMESAQIATAVKLGEMAKEIAEKASGLDKAAAAAVAKPALELASLVPGDVKAATTTLSMLTNYAKARQMQKPSEEDADNQI